jgi:hypothetical protein
LAAHASTLRIEVAGKALAGITAAAASPAATTPCGLAVGHRSASTRCVSGLSELAGAEISTAPTAGCRAAASRATSGCVCRLSELPGAKVFAAPSCATRTASRSSSLVKLAGAEVICPTGTGSPTGSCPSRASRLSELTGAEVIRSRAAYRSGSHARHHAAHGIHGTLRVKTTFEISGRLFFHFAEDFHDAKSGVLGKQQGFTEPVEGGQDFFFHFREKGVCTLPDPLLLQCCQALASVGIELCNFFGFVLELLADRL